MENNLSVKKYEDRMNKELSLENIRNENFEKILHLRKEKRRKDIIANIRDKINLMCESRNEIYINHSKMNNDEVRNFYINMHEPEKSIIKLQNLLNSSDDNEIKAGLCALWTYYKNFLVEIYKNKGEKNKEKNAINNYMNNEEIKVVRAYKNGRIISSTELFIKNDIISLLFEIINRSLNKSESKYISNIYECLYILINMSAIPPCQEDKKIEFFKLFVQGENLNVILCIFKDENIPQEILFNILILLGNITADANQIIKDLLINSSLTQILNNYLETSKKINSEVFMRIYRVLYSLYNNCFNLDLELYKSIFKIFSKPLYKFRINELIKYSLDILLMLSKIKEKEIANCFNDLNLFDALNNIIFKRGIKGNEITVTIILEIFCNIVEKGNKEFQKIIVNSGKMAIFYNNLLAKYKKEKISIDYFTEASIIITLNNLLIFNPENMVKYIMTEGKEILNYCLESAKSVFHDTRQFGINFLHNALIDNQNQINLEILYDIANIALDTLNINKFTNCYILCIQSVYLLLLKSENMNCCQELKTHFIQKGLINCLDKIETMIINDPLLEKETEENYLDRIDEIKEIINN